MNNYIYEFLYDWLFKVFNYGANGVDVYWYGQLLDGDHTPPQPNLNDAYYDLDQDSSYIWNGDAWVLLCTTDLNLSANKTLKWFWDTEPESPVLYDAYFDGAKSVFFNGTEFSDLAFEDIGLNITGIRPSNEIPIIRGLQNAPAPIGTYFVIHYPFEIRKLARVKNSKADINGKLTYYNFYEIEATLEIVKGNSDKFLELFSSIEFQEYRDLFIENGVGFLRYDNINNNPLDYTGKYYDEGAQVNIVLSCSDSVIERAGYIDNVEIRQK
jgi:hypothetical protein